VAGNSITREIDLPADRIAGGGGSLDQFPLHFFQQGESW
jgi:hypothetical protein